MSERGKNPRGLVVLQSSEHRCAGWSVINLAGLKVGLACLSQGNCESVWTELRENRKKTHLQYRGSIPCNGDLDRVKVGGQSDEHSSYHFFLFTVCHNMSSSASP